MLNIFSIKVLEYENAILLGSGMEIATIIVERIEIKNEERK